MPCLSIGSKLQDQDQDRPQPSFCWSETGLATRPRSQTTSLLKPPSHQTKTTKTALRPENFDERSAVVVKKEKCAVFKFILRLYYVPGRFSLRLTRLCQVLTTSNTFPLISYHVHYHARTTSNALLIRSYYDQSDRTTCLTRAYRVITASIRSI